MKKFIVSLAVVMGLSSLAAAAVQAPLDLRGNTLYTTDFVGTVPCVIAGSTGTAAVLCTSGRGVVYGVVITSGTLGNEYVVLRDSATANTTSSSMTLVGVQSNGAAQSLVDATVMQVFPRPIQFLNGLSANLAANPQNGEMWTILYRPLKATE